MSFGSINADRPRDFEVVFVRFGWRGIEHIFGARTSVNKRWIEQSGRDRLRTLRMRFRKGDVSALEEVRNATASA